STGTTDRKMAEAVLGKIRANIVEGRFFDTLEEKQRTFAEMMEKYQKEVSVRKSPKGPPRDRTALQHLLPIFEKLTLAEISPKLISAYKVMRREEGAAPTTINKELGLMRHAFNVAIKEWEWCRDNPVRRVAMEKENNSRVRYLTDEEFERLLPECPDWLRPIVMVARYTGMRRENIVTLRWDQVNLFRKVVLLDQTKNGDRLGIPLCEKVLEVFKVQNKVRRLGSPYVFPVADGSHIKGDAVSMAFIRTCRRIGILDFRFHDLRHTFASMLVQRGVDLYRVQRLLGHRDARMTQRYAHLSPENLREAVAVLDEDCDKFSTILSQSQLLKQGGNETSH
ncbi:MAG TPA: tyrosine-type recombinase/integrase, partial [Nitrospiria bacterium]|nr:tyrosine-type recombinase/integrase [Nitrospiria bacterium]